MNVRLISITQATSPELSGLSPEEIIVYIARVSNPKNQLNTETSGKLLEYMVKHKHWSPFEMVDMTVEIETSRAIAQQIIRHRSLSVQEFSQRYSAVDTFEPIEFRKKAITNRQSSLEPFDPIIDNSNASELIDRHIKNTAMLYHKLLDAGVAKECARMILPLTTQTRLYLKGSVRSWIHYLQLRTAEDTQLEHRQVALAILDIFKENFPITYNAIIK